METATATVQGGGGGLKKSGGGGGKIEGGGGGGGGTKKTGGGGGQNASVGVRRVQAPPEASEGYQDTGGSSRATKGDDSRRNQ